MTETDELDAMVALQKQKPLPRMTVTEFLAWPGDPSGRTWQLIEGEPVAMAPASITHGAIQSEISRIIGNHLRANRPGCRVITAPGISPRVRANTNVRVPELSVTCEPDARGKHLLDAPLLVVEVLSPSNEAKTWANVWTYTTIPSVQEILVVQSLSVAAQLLRRLPDGSWPAEFTPFADADAIIDCLSIGARFALGAFYETTSLLPPRG
jgi:Uma2 family endonuclease